MPSVDSRGLDWYARIYGFLVFGIIQVRPNIVHILIRLYYYWQEYMVRWFT